MHLNTDELVDIAEGTRSEASAPHLAGCDPCRAQLHDLRAMMAAAKDVEVPEPSPLFWEHLSARVSAAVQQETPRRAWLGWRFALGPIEVLAVAAALIVAIVLTVRPLTPHRAPVAAVAEAAPSVELLDDGVAADDPALTLVATLSDEVDLDTAREAGLAPRGSAEHAVTHMSDGELSELGRLLKEELAHSGA